MPDIALNLPMRGYIESTKFTAVPEGFTQGCLNVLPRDVANSRMRIASRNAFTRRYVSAATTRIQHVGSYRAYTSAGLITRTLFVQDGLIYVQNGVNAPALCTGQSTALLSTTPTVQIMGAQVGNIYYFVDGISYVKADLSTAIPAITAWTATSGTLPSDAAGNKASIFSVFGSRIVLSGVRGSSTNWFMSWVGDPTKWDPDPNDAGAGVAGGSDDKYGLIGEEIIALIPLGRSGLVFGCRNSMSYLTADPVDSSNAQLITMSRSIGVVGPRAWCAGPNQTVFVLSKAGLFQLSPNDFAIDKSSSISEAISNVFDRTDFNDCEPTLSFDPQKNWLYITLSRKSTPNNSVHFFYDITTQSFWGFRIYDPRGQPVCATLIDDPNNVFPTVVFGTVNGCLTQYAKSVVLGFDGYPEQGMTSPVYPTVSEAEAQSIKSFIYLGPILSPMPNRYLLTAVDVETGRDEYLAQETYKILSKSPTATLLSGETAQEAVNVNARQVFVTGDDEGLDGGGRTDPTVTVDCGGRAIIGTLFQYDGGNADRPYGRYTLVDQFSKGLGRIWQRLDWLLQYTASKWGIYDDTGSTLVFQHAASNVDPSDAPFIDQGSSGHTVTVTDISYEDGNSYDFGNLSDGDNNRFRCRVRDSAFYIKIYSGGYPWSLERVSVTAEDGGMKRKVMVQ